MIRIVITVVTMNILILLADLSTQTILISGISGMATAIIALVFYIKSLHKTQLNSTEKFTQITTSFSSSLDGLKESVKANTEIMHDVHDRILTAFKA